ncbi:MAG: Hsp70 family protein [Clostridiales bacterium]|jgi:actin-like ATPase involved in cell morphogenesis|nr:Hsp70 family protein [Clostridiales bacterium]
MAVFGIDLGTTYSVIATLDENSQPLVIQNQDEAKATLASAVYFPEDGSSPTVGTEAKNIAETAPDRVAQFIKRYIGKANADAIAERDGLKASFEYAGHIENPITVSSYILKRLMEYAYQQDYAVHDVVITCPAYFTDEERRATRQAGENAGLNVLNIINEPTAAALSYCYNGYQESRKVLVYDLGGGTFDVTIIDMQVDSNGGVVVDAIRTGGNDKLGGVDWDEILYNYILTEYSEFIGIDQQDLDVELKQTIRSRVEATKTALSNVKSKRFSIPYNNVPASVEVTRETFESLTKDLVSQTMFFIDDVLQKAGFSPDDMSDVLLVGGSTLMPMIMDTVKAKFPNSKVVRNDPHLAVAKGAAIFAGLNVQENYLKYHGASPNSKQEQPSGKKEVPPPNVKSGFTAIDRLSHSYGPAVYVQFEDGSSQFMIDNIAFIGDLVPVENVNYYSAMGTELSVDFYSNDSEIRTGDSRFVTPTKGPNDEEQWSDPALNVRYMGTAALANPNIRPGDDITVTITVNNKGSVASVLHEKTGAVKECPFISQSGQTEEETAIIQERFKTLSTRSDVY